ncbi:MAG: hypothetical protein HY049_05780 [Acidobacteria bacterium]|nr:hypothetical protein [Acidobacteriota bacterium]
MGRSFLRAAGIPLLVAVALTAPAVARDDRAADPNAATGTSPDEVAALRAEIEQLRAQVRLLQDQMKVLLAGGGATAGAQAAPSAPAPSAPAVPTRSQGLLNPAISAVFQTIGNTSLKRADDRNGFDLSEAEVAFQSAIDPYAKMDLFLTFPVDGGPEVEEGYVSTLSLPGSLALKAGRFKSAFGKWNTLHNHAFFTIERPLALETVLGGESLTDDGLSMSVLIPNPWGLYLEAITEVGTPRVGPSFNSDRHDLSYLEHVSAFFNTTSSSTLELGLSTAFGRTGPSSSLRDAVSDPNLGATLVPADHRASNVSGVDVTYKWKPPQMNVYRSFLWQTEWLRSRRRTETVGAGPSLDTGVVLAGGGYTYVEGQLTKRWRVGGRYDWTEMPDDASARQSGGALVVRFVPSEFQELRFEADRVHRNGDAAARLNGDTSDTRLLFEWIPIIGAHGAHKY